MVKFFEPWSCCKRGRGRESYEKEKVHWRNTWTLYKLPETSKAPKLRKIKKLPDTALGRLPCGLIGKTSSRSSEPSLGPDGATSGHTRELLLRKNKFICPTHFQSSNDNPDTGLVSPHRKRQPGRKSECQEKGSSNQPAGWRFEEHQDAHLWSENNLVPFTGVVILHNTVDYSYSLMSKEKLGKNISFCHA